MVLIQLELEETLDKKLKYYMVDKDHIRKSDAIKEILFDYLTNN